MSPRSFMIIAFSAAMLASEARAQSGPDLYRRHCAACHSMEAGENRLGPSLANIVGRKAGEAPGYNYSQAMKSANIVWSRAKLEAFLLKPAAEAPGNKMIFSAKTTPEERAAIVSYLQAPP